MTERTDADTVDQMLDAMHESEKTTVYTLLIFHRHGHNLSVHELEAGAVKALVAYCSDWWEEVANGEEEPEDNDTLVQRYFALAEDEHYELEPRELE